MYAATKTATAVCSSAFAFGLPYDIVKAAKGDTQAFQAVASYFKTAPLSMGTMLAHHDIFAGERAGDQFRGDIAAYKLAAAPFLLLPSGHKKRSLSSFLKKPKPHSTQCWRRRRATQPTTPKPASSMA